MSEYAIPRRLQALGVDIQKSELAYHTRRVAVTKEFTFDAAHHLHAYEGKCAKLHGHTYRLVVTVSGYVNDIGIVIDFGDLKRLYEDVIAKRLDHQYLNEVLPPMNTTAENMIVWMWEELERALKAYGGDRDLRLERLDLYETPTSRATLERAWMS